VPSPEAERLFLESFVSTRERFRESLEALQAQRLHLPNTDLDTGQPTARGEYSLADRTYDELLDRLASHRFADLPPGLAENILAYYGVAEQATKTGAHVALLKEICACGSTP
jgi:hypothetical protein